MAQPIKDMLTEADNQTYDVIRTNIFIAMLIINALTIYAVVIRHQDWAALILQYAGAIGALVGSGGLGLYFKSSVETTRTQDANDTST